MEDKLENNNVSYLKADNNKIINETCIKWVKKISECLEVCTKSSGCSTSSEDIHKICKINNLDSYNKLNKFFE